MPDDYTMTIEVYLCTLLVCYSTSHKTKGLHSMLKIPTQKQSQFNSLDYKWDALHSTTLLVVNCDRQKKKKEWCQVIIGSQYIIFINLIVEVQNVKFHKFMLREQSLNLGWAWASPEFKRNIWQIRCTYVCMYVCVWVCMYVAICRPCVHHVACTCNAQAHYISTYSSYSK